VADGARRSPNASGADTRMQLLDAARRVLLDHGFSGLSTRAVAAEAGTQMSQIRYHFGSKEGLVLALFERMNAELIDRQTETFANPDLTLAQKWSRSCDYLEEDLASGFVRVINELIAVGWSDAAVGAAVRPALRRWYELILSLVGQFERAGGRLDPFEADDVAALVASAFMGAETHILLGYPERDFPAIRALRRFGTILERLEADRPKE
jgi:AcrR family transcriptional regulator